MTVNKTADLAILLYDRYAKARSEYMRAVFLDKERNVICKKILGHGDKGTVKVHVTYLDSGELFAEVYKEYLAKSLTSALSGKKNENLLGDIFDEKKPDFPPKTAETDLIFNCTKKDGRWYVDKMPDGCTRVMTSGMTGLLGELISSFRK